MFTVIRDATGAINVMTMFFLGSINTLSQLRIEFVTSSVHLTEINSPCPRLAQSVELRTVNVEDTGLILTWGGVLVLAKEIIVIKFPSSILNNQKTCWKRTINKQ